jgi:uncharacterized membrane protein YccC
MRLPNLLNRLRVRARRFLNLEPFLVVVRESDEPAEEDELPAECVLEPAEDSSAEAIVVITPDDVLGQDEGLGAEFHELLADLGASDAPPDPAAEIASRDATIAELKGMLAGLRGLGDELALATRLRMEAEARCRSLEADLQSLRAATQPAPTEAEPTTERLQKELERRETVLANERERHAATRTKLLERRRIAAERWRELQDLRAQVRRLEQALAEATPPAPLPGAPSPSRAPLAQLMHPDPSALDFGTKLEGAR